jgi:hypothetical protein
MRVFEFSLAAADTVYRVCTIPFCIPGFDLPGFKSEMVEFYAQGSRDSFFSQGYGTELSIRH